MLYKIPFKAPETLRWVEPDVHADNHDISRSMTRGREGLLNETCSPALRVRHPESRHRRAFRLSVAPTFSCTEPNHLKVFTAIHAPVRGNLGAQSRLPSLPTTLIIFILSTCSCVTDAVLNATAMLSSPRYSRHTRRDRLSVSVIPERSLDTEPRSAYLHWLFGESSEIDINSRLVEEDISDSVDDGTGYKKADAVVMREVAAWLELHEQDDIWVARRKHAGKASL